MAPLCREPPVFGPDVLGSQTLRAFGSAFWFGPSSRKEGPWLGPLFTCGFLLYLAALLWRGGRRPGAKPGLIRPLVTYYIVVTALVEITRCVWDVSRFALVWAALHNLAEWGVIVFALLPDEPVGKGLATRAWWVSQLWILLVANWVIFAPTLLDAGLGEQVAGLTCDWLLMIVWGRLVYLGPRPVPAFAWFGLAAACLHMAEILPLVALLVGLVPTPWIPGCILISVTTPLTFWLYSCMVARWQALPGQDDLVTPPAATGEKAPAASSPGRSAAARPWTIAALIALSALLATATLFVPVGLFPPCPPAQMKVPPGHKLAPEGALLPVDPAMTGTASGVPVSGQTPTAGSAAPGAAMAAHPGAALCGVGSATNESLCASATKLIGTTTVFAKPGRGKEMLDMAATMPGPIRQEPGNRYYELAAGEDEIKYWESWSSISSLYRHIYTSPTVAAVFRSELFKAATLNMTLEGPFKATLPCSEAQAEAKPVVLPFTIEMDASIDVVWAKISNWAGDVSWVKDSKHVTALTPFLREVDFGTTKLVEILQVPPLAPPEQPQGGHRLIYHVLSGAFMDTIGEAYSGNITLLPSVEHPGKTIFSYVSTLVGKTPEQTTQFAQGEAADFKNSRLPFLKQWARDAAAAALDAKSVGSS